MWNRGSMGLKVAPQFREPSDGFCGLKLAGWETCISYYLSSSLGHILGTKKSAWLNRGHLLLLSWSQASVLIENHSLSPLSTPHSTFAHQLPNQEPLWPPHCQVQWIPFGSYHDPLSILSLLVTVWDHLISSFFWKHPLSIEEHNTLLNFPLSVDTTSHSLLLAHVLLLCISWDFSQCCPRPLLFLNNPVYGPGFQYPWHHWFSNRGRVVKSHLPGDRFFQIAHTAAGVLNAQPIPGIRSHSGSFGDGGSSVVCDVYVCWETLISCWQIPIHQLHQVRVGSNTHIHLDVR